MTILWLIIALTVGFICGGLAWDAIINRALRQAARPPPREQAQMEFDE